MSSHTMCSSKMSVEMGQLYFFLKALPHGHNRFSFIDMRKNVQNEARALVENGWKLLLKEVESWWLIQERKILPRYKIARYSLVKSSC